jgi:ribosome-associated translation inhibitor RaiA
VRISTTSPHIRLDDALRRTAEQRPNVVLRRISHRIDHISITLTDDNGLRGGVDKQCRVRVEVRGLGVVTTDARHDNLLAAIDKALRRARRIILKRLKRRVARSRKQPAAYTESNGSLDVAFAT